MDIKTIPGRCYGVTSAAGCTVTDSNGNVLASVEAGVQTSIQATTAVTSVSDDNAVVLSFEGAPAAALGGGGSSSMVEQMVDAALYSTSVTQYRSIVGSGNASLHWLQLDARRVPAGKLQAISIPCRDTAGSEAPSGQAVYLTLWELTAEGSDYTMLGSSTEAVQQVVNETSRWEFEGIELSGRTFRICAASSPGVWDESQWLGVRMAAREDGETSRGVGHGNVNQVADITFELVSVAPRFASTTDVAEHAQDTVVHVTAEERTRWDAAAPATHVGDATHLQNGGQKLVVKGMDGAVKLTIQGLLTNAQVTGNALYVNVPDFSQRVTSTCIYSNSESASYVPWFAAAIDATALQPFGIAEPGVHVGHAGYPLRLRGSVVSINGVSIDVAALAQLIEHKDELLALLDTAPENTPAGGDVEK